MAKKKVTSGRPKGATRYTKESLFETAKKAIQDHCLYFMNDLVAYMPIAKNTMYYYFPAGSPEHEEMMEMMDNNKIRTKTEIKKKLLESQKAAELIALYRLLSTREEHQLLNQSYVDHTTNGKEMNIPISKWIEDEE